MRDLLRTALRLAKYFPKPNGTLMGFRRADGRAVHATTDVVPTACVRAKRQQQISMIAELKLYTGQGSELDVGGHSTQQRLRCQDGSTIDIMLPRFPLADTQVGGVILIDLVTRRPTSTFENT